MSYRIRSESQADADAIRSVTEAAFLDAPHTSHTEAFIVDALRCAGALSVSLVAEHDGRVIGHVAVSPVTIAGAAGGWYGLGPISVVPEHQGRGVGALLMRTALDRLREQGAAGCVLVGDPAWYVRFGFVQAAPLVYPGVPPVYFQALSFGAPVPVGEVAFHAAFRVGA